MKTDNIETMYPYVQFKFKFISKISKVPLTVYQLFIMILRKAKNQRRKYTEQ